VDKSLEMVRQTMIGYNPRCDRAISDIEKRGIEENLINCIEHNFGDIIAMAYKSNIKKMFSPCKTKYQIRDCITKIEDELNKVYGKTYSEKFKDSLEHKLGYDIFFKGGVEIKSLKMSSS
jgi:hypothetical protein